MTTVEAMTITIDTLGYNIKTELAEFIYMTVHNVYERAEIDSDEFKAVLNSGMRSDLESNIRKHYNFVKDLEIEISDSDYYDLHVYMTT